LLNEILKSLAGPPNRPRFSLSPIEDVGPWARIVPEIRLSNTKYKKKHCEFSQEFADFFMVNYLIELFGLFQNLKV
jgi:hypothetical protein